MLSLLLVVPLAASPAAAAPADPGSGALPVSDAFRPAAALGFHDLTRDGSDREIRDDLSGDLGGMVELVQASVSDPSGNAGRDKPTATADRAALLLFTPTRPVAAAEVEVRVSGRLVGTLDLAHPNLLPAADQQFDGRGTVAYSLRAWSAELPATWMKPGLSLSFSADGRSGDLDRIELAAPLEMVINNIRLGMATDAPVSDDHAFIVDPVGSATDYFQTVPLAKLTMARYETVELDEVIVGTGEIYSADRPDPSEGSVYAGKMREDVGKAQVSTGINLATWGITSSPMNQKQPGSTNQRVIHHSAGLYANGVVSHGLSGGNGMATLYSSRGNELSHELGHSYGIGHYPGRDAAASGDDVIRNASHHMDSGWGYIGYRGLMRSNLDTGAFQESKKINGDPFGESLAGRYGFNTDAMAGGWDASPVSQYTHHTAWTLTRVQQNLKTLVADTQFPSGYRSWDADAGAWVDAKAKDPAFSLLRPQEVAVPVFTILGGYNPADSKQTLVYPAFRSNYGVTFDLPQADPASSAAERACWLEITFQGAPTQHVALDASDGVKQLNVNVAESAVPTGAQVACRAGGTTTLHGEAITIATDLEPMPQAVVVGGENGFEALRAQELGELEPTLEALAGAPAPVLGADDLVALTGWSDDLSLLGSTARTVADRILGLVADARDVEAYLTENRGKGAADEQPTLVTFLSANGYVDDDGAILPTGGPVTVDGGRCLFLADGVARIDSAPDGCSDADGEWFVDAAQRIHPVENPEVCLAAASPTTAAPCSVTDSRQRWVVQDDGHVVRAQDTSSALDYNRQAGHAGLYRVSNGSNQIWSGLEANSNPLLAYLSADGLAALAGSTAELADVVATSPPTVNEDAELGEMDDAAPAASEATADSKEAAARGTGLAATGAALLVYVVLGVLALAAGVSILVLRKVRAER